MTDSSELVVGWIVAALFFAWGGIKLREALRRSPAGGSARWRRIATWRNRAQACIFLALGLSFWLSSFGDPTEHQLSLVIGLLVVVLAVLATVALGFVAGQLEAVARRSGTWDDPIPARPDAGYSDENQDPGWEAAFRMSISRSLLFGFLRPLAAADSVVVTRMIFLALCESVVLFTAALSFLIPFYESTGGSIPWIIVAVALASWLAARGIRRRPLNMSSAHGLATSYRARMFMGIGFAETPRWPASP